jgi:O-antigen ligase
MLMVSLILNFIYQAIAFAWPSLYSLIGNTLLYEGHREFVAFNLARGRIFIETYDEIVLPFLFMSGLYKGTRGKLYRSILPFLIVVPTLLSNFRSRLMMLVVSFGLTFIAWIRSWKTAMIMGVIAVVLLLAVDTMSLRLWGFSLIDRVLLKSNYDDVQSLTSRWEGINTSFEMGLSHPATGVGIGNYFDFLPTSTRNSVFSLVNYYGGVWVSSLNPHNIFAQIVAETGLIGLLYYLFMLGVFIKYDWKIFKQPKKSEFTTACVIAFWSLFSYSVFNPSTTLTYNTLFWILRGMVIYESAD